MKAKILIIDDDEITRLLLMKYATKMDLDADIVATGEEALEYIQLKGEQYHIIISDLFLPDITGIELLKKIRKNLPSVDFVLITGHASIDSTVEAIREGASDYIFKPVNFEEFSIRITSILNRKELKTKLLEAEKRLMYQATITTANHEINQPLTVIISGIDMMRMELKRMGVDSPVLSNYLSLIHASSQRIANILKRFREINKPKVKSIPRGMKLIEMDEMFDSSVLSNLTVLIIEDEESILKIIQQILQKKGLKTIAANNGWDGIRIFESGQKIDLVLMDLNLPDIDYQSLFDHLKNIDKNCPILIMSGYATENEIQELLDKGAQDFILKPFNSETLFSKLYQVLRNKNL
ncbi:MAG: hypothetical protein Kow00108_01010 [Calditrichia bacterium]